ncbi:WD40 repeat domain-containing protein [Streptomyces gelaticus]|uniref:WD40 repeat domain-containing protein n=1 Tax=Streptomyces gelaticus TaxID=285446 RepID=UPI0037B14D1A
MEEIDPGWCELLTAQAALKPMAVIFGTGFLVCAVVWKMWITLLAVDSTSLQIAGGDGKAQARQVLAAAFDDHFDIANVQLQSGQNGASDMFLITLETGSAELCWPDKYQRTVSLESSSKPGPGNFPVRGVSSAPENSDDALRTAEGYAKERFPWGLEGSHVKSFPVGDKAEFGRMVSWRSRIDGVLMPMRLDVQINRAGRVSQLLTRHAEGPVALPPRRVDEKQAVTTASKYGGGSGPVFWCVRVFSVMGAVEVPVLVRNSPCGVVGAGGCQWGWLRYGFMAGDLQGDGAHGRSASVGGLLTDPAWLVNADPREVFAVLDGAMGREEVLAAVVYRASADVHRKQNAGQRRFVLAVDAARFGDRGLAARLAAVDVPGARPVGWQVAWATGSLADVRLLRTLTGHEGWVTTVATAVADGRAVAVTGSRDNSVRVWDLATGREVCAPLVCRTDTWTSQTAEVTYVATATVDGRDVALLLEWLHGEERVLLLDLADGSLTGECVRIADVTEWDGLSVVLTVENDRTLRMWSVATGEEIGSSLPARILNGPDEYPVAVSAELGGAVRIWDRAGDVLEPASVDDAGDLSDAPASAVVADGRLVAFAFDAFDIDGFHDGETAVAVVGSLSAACGRPSGDVVPVSHLVEVAGRPVTLVRRPGGSLRVWDRVEGCRIGEDGWVVRTAELCGQPIRLPLKDKNQEHRAWQLAYPAAVLDEDVIVQQPPASVVGTDVVGGRALWLATEADHAVRLWDATTGATAGERLAGHTDRVRAAAAVVVDEQVVAVTAGLDRTVRVWDVATGRQINGPLNGHTAQVWDVATATMDGRPVAVTAGADCTVRVWDLGQARGEHRPVFGGHDDALLAATTITLHGTPVIVTAGTDKTVRTWDLATGTPVAEPIATEVCAMVAAEVDGRAVVVTAAPDATIRRWDLASGQETGQPFAGHTSRILALTTAQVEGRSVAVTGGSDGTAHVWDLATGRQFGPPLTGHTSRITALATATVDGHALAATGSWDKTVRLWDLATGRQIGEPLTGHTDWVTSLSTTTMNGHPVAVTASRDATVRTWSLLDCKQIAEPLPCPAGAVRSMTTMANGNSPHLITTCGSGEVSVYDLATGAEIAAPLAFPSPVHALLAAPDGRLVVGFGPEIALLSPLT